MAQSLFLLLAEISLLVPVFVLTMENLEVIEANLDDQAPAPRWKRHQQRQVSRRSRVSALLDPCLSVATGSGLRPRDAGERSASNLADQSAVTTVRDTTVLREHNHLSSPAMVSRKRSRSALPSPTGRGGPSPRCDRFIPDRSAMDLEVGRYALTSALGRSATPYSVPEEALNVSGDLPGQEARPPAETISRSASLASPERSIMSYPLGDRSETSSLPGSSPASVARLRRETMSRVDSWASSLDTLPSLPSSVEELTDEWHTGESTVPAGMADVERIDAPGAVDVQQLAQQHEYQSQLAAELGASSLLDHVSHANTNSWACTKDDFDGTKAAQSSGRAGASSAGHSTGAKILAFKPRPPARVGEKAAQAAIAVVYSQNRLGEACRRHLHRHIPSAPERILDAPEMVDDYYLNLLDWSAGNVLAVALGSAVYLWNASTGSIEQLLDLAPSGQNVQQDYVCSIKWVHGDGSGVTDVACAPAPYLAVGTAQGQVQIWDVETNRRLRTLRTHQGRVGSLDWNGPMLCSGSRDSTVQQHDVRQARHLAATLLAHEQEVCGLQWSPNGTQLASGGNDNLLLVWDCRSLQQPRLRFDEHTAAVKALGWCPWQGHLLASGGGTSDRMLRFWNTNTGACLQAIDTESQVCALQWSVHHRELVTGHGFSRNQLIVWKYPNLSKVAELTGHTARVLHLASSPDGQTVVSAAADETLRFWKIFPKPQLSRFGVGKALTAAAVHERLVPEDTRPGGSTTASAAGASKARGASIPAVWKSLGARASSQTHQDPHDLDENAEIGDYNAYRGLSTYLSTSGTNSPFTSATHRSQKSSQMPELSRGSRVRVPATMHSTIIR